MEFKVNSVEVLTGLHDTKILLTLPGLGAADADKLSAANRPWRCKLTEWREKRSLDANAYFWVLLDKLSTVLQVGKEELYRRYIRDVGGASQIVCIKAEAADALISGWSHNGLGWQAEQVPSKLDGCVNVVLYYGSSCFDSKQMAQLIDLLIQDAEAIGIPTLTEAQAATLVGRWNNGKEHHAG